MFAIRKRLAVGISITSAMALMVSAVAAGDYRQVNFPVENCINLGSGLESPEEGQWGYNIKQEHFGIIRAKGFDTVRIPVKWTKWVPEGVWQPTYNPSPLSHFNRSLSQAPYTINPAFLSRVDEVISWAMQAGLKVVVNVHHFDELEIEPANPATYNNQEKRLIAIWKQLGEHYRNMPSGLMFEIINEPKGQFQGEYLNRTQLAALAEIRKTNPTRTVILTGDQTGGVPGIDNLRLPPNDLNVVASVHSYTP
ncbi:MAG: cellulase family glycosylhydrolase [Methylococcaceae bacterium]|nr:cellulase family glycosylhydrolase [Methylococcaceae bacterium]